MVYTLFLYPVYMSSQLFEIYVTPATSFVSYNEHTAQYSGTTIIYNLLNIYEYVKCFVLHSLSWMHVDICTYNNKLLLNI